MYYINWKLIEFLPQTLGTSYTAWAKMVGKTPACVGLWGKNRGMSVYDLVQTCNKFHMSISNFISDTEVFPTLQKHEYIIQKEVFQPVVFRNEMIGEIYGSSGMINISQYVFCKELGVPSKTVNSWIRDIKVIRLATFIRIMNKFNLNINLFITDPNKMLPFTKPKIVEIFNDEFILMKEKNEKLIKGHEALMEENKMLHSVISQKDKLISSLAVKSKRMEEEIKAYKEGTHLGQAGYEQAYPGALSENNTPYKRKVRGYKFHYELLRSIPDLFEVYKADFLKKFSLKYSFFKEDSYNISIEKLIDICNYYRISIHHFFVPEYNMLLVRDREYYEINKTLFSPITSQLENIKFLFGRYSVLDIPFDKLKEKTNTIYRTYHGWMRKDGASTLRVMALIDICNKFNLSPSLFVEDPNKRNIPCYPESQNETLLLNCIEMKKQVVGLLEENKRLKKKHLVKNK